MISGPPLPTLSLGRSAKRALHRAFRAARSARRLRHPHHQEATRAVIGGATCTCTCRRPGAQRPCLRCRARSARRRLGCRRRPGAQRPRHRRRARSARRRWQPAAAPPGAARHTGAQRRAPCAVRRAPSARRRSGSPQAPGAQRPRHRRRARSARRRQLRAGMLAQPAHGRHTDTLGGFCLLAHNSKIVGGLKTMSPAPGRRPPIYRVA